MPHLVMDYSADHLGRDRIAVVMEQLAVTAAATGVMHAADIKVRARGFDDYLVAGRRDSFVHLAVFMLAGRTPEQKEALSIALRQTLVEHCADITSLSVDIRDMDPVAYKKRLKQA
ncbi:5-carboxymethyl-2-hydroxymuconate Delta-isomerase [Rhodopseudomonas palustris]|uniref:5-carboxymethyl-2-hydroxymuconate Delta-isomerase n=1 Tax=Rhodopseudomonas palustris TaxID=1076 RepID=UPI0020CDDFEC|nr:5-carboxymethyl-2-hydroxymuconate Delta-isomerase [Rhodopseudomonas palustris]MCP9630296.1 5-carboxymethyl-2-hydroxymuconate Delta-isomerase [Rhodopseudomonas palustris]